MVYVYECENFQRERKNFSGEKKAIDSFIENLRKQLTEEAAEHFMKSLRHTGLFKRVISGHLRLITEKTRVSLNGTSHPAYCLKTLMIKTSRDYMSLTGGPNVAKDCREWQKNNPLPIEEIKKWVEEQEREKNKKTPLPSLPEELMGWLKGSSEESKVIYDGDSVIYESEDWVKETRKKFFQIWWASFYEILVHEILEDKTSEGFQARSHRDNVSIVYQRCHLGNRDIYFLISLFEEEPSSQDLEKLKKKYSLSTTGGEEELQILIAHSKRAYPDYIPFDKDLWEKIELEETGEEANLALSGEEEELLRTARVPLFINGRAGSGKSTMLFYIFSDYCGKRLIVEQNDSIDPEAVLKGTPLFLTYSPKLLNAAHQNVVNILSTHAKHLQQNLGGKETIKEQIKRFFHSFRNYVVNLLPAPLKAQFTPSQWISFSLFKRLYQEDCHLPEKKKYSPEIVWHVIRTFIKGYSVEDYLSPQEYQKINRNDRSVDQKSYQEIYQTLWEHWYKHMTHPQGRRWDDQDLIRFVLTKWNEKEIQPPQYPVIFCDEAQDFTRIELEFLLRSSEFTSYDLSYQSAVPFAFAGDPFQTINPTGFSWQRLKETFYRKVEDLKSKEIKLDMKELRQNYRSAPGVVYFANLIQYYRYSLLNEKELYPQNTWFSSQSAPLEPSLFIEGENIEVTDLKQANLMIIVPCEESEIPELVEKDAFLKELADISEVNERVVISNVISCMESKGLEFDKVILYRFGDQTGSLFKEIVGKQVSEDHLEESQSIQLSYFLNRLYVAATRAKRELFIIDTPEGEENLWKFFFQSQNLYESDRKAEDEERWQDRFAYLRKGDRVETRDIRSTKEELQSIADMLRKQGENEANPALLEKASRRYEELGDENSRLECLAMALKFREKWAEAGAIYERLNIKELASDCYWEGACWRQLSSLHEKDRGERYVARKTASDFMLSEQIKNLLECKAFKNMMDPFEKAWIKVIEKLSEVVAIQFRSIRSKGVKNKLMRTLETLSEKGFPELQKQLSQICFEEGDYQKAIEFWEQMGETNIPEYFEAKAHLSQNLSEKIFYLHKAKKFAEALGLFLEREELLSRERLSQLLHSLNQVPLKGKERTLLLRVLDNLQEQEPSGDILEETRLWEASMDIYKDYSQKNPDYEDLGVFLVKSLLTASKKFPPLWILVLEILQGRPAIRIQLLLNCSRYSRDLLRKNKEIPSRVRQMQNNLRFRVGHFLDHIESKLSKSQKKEVKKFLHSPFQNLREFSKALKNEQGPELSSPILSILETPGIIKELSPYSDLPQLSSSREWAARLVTAIASSNLNSDESFSVPEKNLIENFITGEILQWDPEKKRKGFGRNLEESLSFSLVGTALEKIGARYRTQVVYYEKVLGLLRDNPDEEQEKWTKIRLILALKNWQEEMYEKAPSKAMDLRLEVETKKKKWAITEEDLAGKEEAAPLKQWHQEIQIEGLPGQVSIQRNEEYRHLSFSLEPYQITISHDRRVRVNNNLTFSGETFLLQRLEIQSMSPDPTVQKTIHMVRFQVDGYSGIMTAKKLELEIGGNSIKIGFEE